MYHTPYKNSKQLAFDLKAFDLPFGGRLRIENRWVQLRDMIPWVDFEENYKKKDYYYQQIYTY